MQEAARIAVGADGKRSAIARMVAAPTNDGLTMTIVYWPQAEFDEVRADIEGHVMRAMDLVPALAQRVGAGSRAEMFMGSADLRGFFRRPYGPGWALVGDAAYHKNPITAEGITDAFRDAELLAGAIDAFAGRCSTEDALGAYERKRNETVMPLYQMTCDLAKLGASPPEMQALFAALRNDGEQSSRFIGTIAGTAPIPEFFSPENVRRVTGASGG